MIISAGTVVSSLMSDRLTRRLGAGRVTAISVGMTAAALLGFSVSGSFPMLCILAVPYGLGAGSVDAALNNYVALHYASRHMSWLHCMWGLGASAGPYIMGYALTGGQGWNMGYRYIAVLQIALTVILIFSLPMWKKRPETGNGEGEGQTLSLRQIVKIPGARETMLTFFCYCAVEQTAGLWGTSFLVLAHGLSPEEAAIYGSLFFVGITLGRAASGFLTMALDDARMVRLGIVIILAAICTFLPFLGSGFAKAGLVLMGVGCAPVYPCIIHATPLRFGADRSQAIIGVQMASAYIGILLMPPLFGMLADHITIWLFPVFLLAITAVMGVMHEATIRKAGKRKP